jgi:hypothetical protein
MDFSIPFQKAWTTYKQNFVELIVGYLIMVVVSALTLGIFFPGLYAGYLQVMLGALRKKKINSTKVFAGLGQYWNMTGLFIYASLILFLLAITVIGIIPAMLIGTWWMYASIFVADKKFSITKSMATSKKIVRKNNLWLHLIFLIIVGIIGNAGFSLAFIGGLITMPFSMLVLCAAYEMESK